MYYLSQIEDTVRVPPYKFEEDLNDVAIEILNQKYDGAFDKDLGLMVNVNEILEIGEGRVVMGDGAAFYSVVFNAVFFKPEQQEIIYGKVEEIAEYGAFIRIGPLDGLVHVSQVTDDYINYDSKAGKLNAKESKKILEEGNLVRARIVALSFKGKSKDEAKIGLTMRQYGLGRLEWIDQDKNKKTTKTTKSKKSKK
ncbi:MAG: DNA-directed RNA polymerase [Methanobrevibacter sp.]|nr:DNA-directed RNA polymerase [Candidatus Methanoflexus mossambicus]